MDEAWAGQSWELPPVDGWVTLLLKFSRLILTFLKTPLVGP